MFILHFSINIFFYVKVTDQFQFLIATRLLLGAMSQCAHFSKMLTVWLRVYHSFGVPMLEEVLYSPRSPFAYVSSFFRHFETMNLVFFSKHLLFSWPSGFYMHLLVRLVNVFFSSYVLLPGFCFFFLDFSNSLLFLWQIVLDCLFYEKH